MLWTLIARACEFGHLAATKVSACAAWFATAEMYAIARREGATADEARKLIALSRLIARRITENALEEHETRQQAASDAILAKAMHASGGRTVGKA